MSRPYGLAAAGAAGACSGGAPAAPAYGVGGIDGEPVVGHVDFHFAGFRCEFFVDEEGEVTHFSHIVGVLRLIQSQSQSRTRSAAGCEVNTHRSFLFIRKVAFQLLLSGFANIDHLRPPCHWLGTKHVSMTHRFVKYIVVLRAKFG